MPDLSQGLAVSSGKILIAINDSAGLDNSGRFWQKAHHGQGRHRLTAPGLPYQPESRAGLKLETNSVNYADVARFSIESAAKFLDS